MNHNFNTDFAKEYGLVEAILIENLYFWCKKNLANEKNIENGKAWTYNSVKAFNELFPYLTPHKINRALKTLEEKELIEVGNFNENPYDRTKWYTITDKAVSTLKYPTLHLQKNANGKDEKRKCTNIENRKCSYSTDIKHSYKPNNKQWKVIEPLELSENLSNALLDFMEFRTKIKSPLTERALELLLKKLGSIANTEQEKIDILNQSIMNGWKGVFPLRNQPSQNSSKIYGKGKEQEYLDSIGEW